MIAGELLEVLLGYTVTESESWFSGDSWEIAVSVARLHRDRI